MADTVKINGLRLKPADNGFILSYEEVTKKAPSKGDTYSNCSYRDVEEVFTTEQVADAVAKMISLAGMMKKG